MDRSVYIAMTGATQTMRAQDAVSHNLANASTVGFKAELSAFQSVPVLGPGANTRINAVAQGVGADETQGSIQHTGRSLDVAVNGPGWVAVQAADGTEAYTRAGNLQLDADGNLTDSRGNPVMGTSGPIDIPQSSKISVGTDGTISSVPMGQGPDTIAAVGQIKLVNPDPTQMSEGSDGLMHMNDGSTADTDSTVTITSGALEASNVNPSSELVKMISLSRQYEMQVRSIKTSEDDADDSSKLLQAS
ncbi:flagellar basal-body rod protein FlgF [Dyella caseinilytica]|uniref:Flagellar basal-body rod protein FlgF n=1 Tax=Dyella caseinilytica TaxID=1849581 RepID=A0ABX7GTP5_9GAMM|nr:flagellar basal-body rod protein FlgF [Dyella caseinilytica]QRN53428.1 flagellar basal-body rod protein FlgF [Dyella caseinilytica]GFZ86493.1 flagellar basal-body rod protein FlgF [Dyella caseinilytica]